VFFFSFKPILPTLKQCQRYAKTPFSLFFKNHHGGHVVTPLPIKHILLSCCLQIVVFQLFDSYSRPKFIHSSSSHAHHRLLNIISSSLNLNPPSAKHHLSSLISLRVRYLSLLHHRRRRYCSSCCSSFFETPHLRHPRVSFVFNTHTSRHHQSIHTPIQSIRPSIRPSIRSFFHSYFYLHSNNANSQK